MKKTKLFKLALVATVTCFTACSNNAEEMLGQEIKLTSEITPSRVTSLDYQSTQIVEGQQVGITITGAKGEHNNVVWTTGVNGALINEKSPIYWGDTDVTVTSYHPYNANYNGTSYTFSVKTDQSTNAGYLNSDLLWATKTASITDNPISLKFTHKLAKINVTLTSEDITDLSNAEIFICGTDIATGFNPTTGELSTVTSNIAEIKASITTDKAYTGSAIIVPQIVKKGIQLIKITHNNKDFHYTLPEDMEYKSGYSYEYTLQVKDSNMENPIEGEESKWQQKITFQCYFNFQRQEAKDTLKNGLFSLYNEALEAIKGCLSSENETIKLKAATYIIQKIEENPMGETDIKEVLKGQATRIESDFPIINAEREVFDEKEYKRLLIENGVKDDA